MVFQGIKTKRLTIDLYNQDDIDQIFAYRKDPRVYEQYSMKPDTKDDLIEYFKDNISEFNEKNGYSVFILKKDDIVVGDITLSYWGHENKINSIGYAVNPVYQRQGFAFEAMHELLEYLFGIVGRHRIQAEIDPDNISSIKLLEKLGFIREGVLRQVEYSDEVWKDAWVYSMLKSDWGK